jgi:uncharacterized protein (DUF58 family)
MKGKLWWAFLGVLFLIAIATRRGMLSVLILVLALAAAFSAIWARYALSKVTYHRRLANTQIGYGEETTLTLEFVNAKPLPLAWLIVEDRFPRPLRLLTEETRYTVSREYVFFSTVLALRWYERVTHTHRVLGSQRGHFHLGPAELTSGDLFGFRLSRRDDTETNDLTVYPKVVPVSALGLPTGRPIGEWLGPRRIIEDPLRFAAVRDYVPGDNPRSIHWHASARTGVLQTKVFEPSATHLLALAVDAQTTPQAYSYIPEHLELVASAAASLAVHALSQRHAVGLWTNDIGPGGQGWTVVQPGRHPQQSSILLSALAGLGPISGSQFLTVLRMMRRKLQYGATVLAITAMPNDEIYQALFALRESGHPVQLYTVGDEPYDVPEQLPCFHLGGRNVWQRLEALELA